jgi:hypothetical protein
MREIGSTAAYVRKVEHMSAALATLVIAVLWIGPIFAMVGIPIGLYGRTVAHFRCEEAHVNWFQVVGLGGVASSVCHRPSA